MALATTIPLTLIKQLIPVLMKQMNALSAAAEKFIKQVNSIPKTAKCDDPLVKAAKRTLKRLYDLIEKIKRGLNSINRITPVINTVSRIASTLSIIQLVIPAIPGVPTGPISKLISTFDNIGKNAKSSVSSLQGMVSAIETRFARINQLIAKALSKLSSICDNETFPVTPDINEALSEYEASLNSNIILNDGAYPTEFYNELNVSDDDITGRLTIIEDLVNQQLNVLTNLKEAPSKVLAGVGLPTNDIGDIDDYYIDTENFSIYGPKTDIGWDGGINI